MIGKLEESLATDPLLGQAHLRLVRLYLSQNKPSLAKKHYDQAGRLGIDLPPELAEQLEP